MPLSVNVSAAEPKAKVRGAAPSAPPSPLARSAAVLSPEVRPPRSCAAPNMRPHCRVIEKNFVGHDGHAAAGANFGEFRRLARFYKRSGGIVGMHDEHGARAWRERGSQRVEIDLPAVIVEQRVRNQAHVGKIGKKLEQRVARSRNQNFISRFAQQAKDIAVPFARTRGKHDIFRINRFYSHAYRVDRINSHARRIERIFRRACRVDTA